ncbi:Pimeloyl-ACP methyl ester carboxylesterase [Devosia sp. YR412]|uniref:alpha/beta fold hydrolase n=1 Tax=Devosia sp. YR412 TaxID=1881030 RepID=UPI0008AD70B7|nr:alpha/beta hydrolase [Devosia sp. YR412]SEP81466.1 Pimeloyl-ACP methyl ester carboxylesterase [Devosia sp. YR412]
MLVRLNACLLALALSVPGLAAQEHGAPNPTTSGYARANGVDVYYATYGEGVPLVLLHGGLGTVEMFGPVLSLLAANRQVIGIDLQAHGRTPAHARPMTYENLADDVADLLLQLGYAKADVVGYSIGGGVAMQLGIRHPDIVDKLVLVSVPFNNGGWKSQEFQQMAGLSSGLAEPMKNTPVYDEFAAFNPDPEANWPKLLDQLGNLVSHRFDYADDLQEMNVTTMIVVGDHDAVPISHAARFFELLGGGKAESGWVGGDLNRNRLAVLPGLTHQTIFDSPSLAGTVIGFLDDSSE